jgi:hypothetical protein
MHRSWIAVASKMQQTELVDIPFIAFLDNFCLAENPGAISHSSPTETGTTTSTFYVISKLSLSEQSCSLRWNSRSCERRGRVGATLPESC